MATLHVKNTSSIGKAFKVRGGFHVVAAGASEDVPNARPLTDEQIAALALEGLTIKLVDAGDKTAAAGPGRNADGDTPEMAEMRKQFDASYGAMAKQLKAVADAFGDAEVNEANVDQRVTALIADLKAKDDEIASLKAGEAKPNDPPSERDELKKQAGELGIEYAKNISTEKLKDLIDAKLAA